MSSGLIFFFGRKVKDEITLNDQFYQFPPVETPCVRKLNLVESQLAVPINSAPHSYIMGLNGVFGLWVSVIHKRVSDDFRGLNSSG